MKRLQTVFATIGLLTLAAIATPFATAQTSCSASGVCCIWTCKPGCSIVCSGLYGCASCTNAYCNWYGGSEAAVCQCVNCDTGKVRPVPLGDVILVVRRPAAA